MVGATVARTVKVRVSKVGVGGGLGAEVHSPGPPAGEPAAVSRSHRKRGNIRVIDIVGWLRRRLVRLRGAIGTLGGGESRISLFMVGTHSLGFVYYGLHCRFGLFPGSVRCPRLSSRDMEISMDLYLGVFVFR